MLLLSSHSTLIDDHELGDGLRELIPLAPLKPLAMLIGEPPRAA